MNGVYNAHNDRDDAGVLVFQHLPCAAALTIDQHRVADAGLAVIQGDEIAAFVLLVQAEGLHDQQAAVLESRVADGGDDRSDNFTDDHVPSYVNLLLPFLRV